MSFSLSRGAKCPCRQIDEIVGNVFSKSGSRLQDASIKRWCLCFMTACLPISVLHRGRKELRYILFGFEIVWSRIKIATNK